MSGPRLIIAIVNWRSAKLTIDCLASLEPEVLALQGCRVLVVDNDSGDGSEQSLREAIARNRWSSWVEVLQTGRNGGFAAGNNVAIRYALKHYPGFEFVSLLNPDTLVRPGAYGTLLEFMATRPEVGIAGGRSEDPDATAQDCCFRFPSLTSEFASYLALGLFDRLVKKRLTRVEIPEEPIEIDWVSGAHMMIRRQVLEDIGLMDEGYFLYFEETDFTLRAKRAGWVCWHVPQSRVIHLVGQSSGISSRDHRPPRRPSYWFTSRNRYFVLNHGYGYALLTDGLVIMAECLNRVRGLIQRTHAARPPRFLRDFIRGSAFCNRVVSVGPRAISP